MRRLPTQLEIRPAAEEVWIQPWVRRFCCFDGAMILKGVAAHCAHRDAAFIVEGDLAHCRELKIGIRGTSEVEVLSGLLDGARVIAAYPGRLADGARVKATGE